MTDKLLSEWLWLGSGDTRNEFLKFRKKLVYSGEPAVTLKLTADSRYYLWVNGERIGFGPVRAYPEHYKYDVYDLTRLLKPGENVLCVLVNHFGESTMQYKHAAAGL